VVALWSAQMPMKGDTDGTSYPGSGVKGFRRQIPELSLSESYGTAQHILLTPNKTFILENSHFRTPKQNSCQRSWYSMKRYILHLTAILGFRKIIFLNMETPSLTCLW